MFQTVGLNESTIKKYIQEPRKSRYCFRQVKRKRIRRPIVVNPFRGSQRGKDSKA